MTSATPPLVAVVESTADLVALVAELLADEGYRTAAFVRAAAPGGLPQSDAVTGYMAGTVHRLPAAPEEAAACLHRLDPAACIYSIDLPFREHWQRFRALQALLPALPFMLTTTDPQALRTLAGEPLEPIAKPFDVELLLAAVRSTVAGAPPR